MKDFPKVKKTYIIGVHRGRKALAESELFVLVLVAHPELFLVQQLAFLEEEQHPMQSTVRTSYHHQNSRAVPRDY